MRGRVGTLCAAAIIAACGGGATPSSGLPPGNPGGGGDPGGDPGTDPGGGGIVIPGTAFAIGPIERGYRFLAVDAAGMAYALREGESPGRLYASPDARAWTLRASNPAGGSFLVMTALASGALLADVGRASGHVIVRSEDGGRTFADVLALAPGYRLLTPHSVAELGGEVFLLEYQSFTGDAVPIRLWASADDGRTWSERALYTEHRHGHGLLADPAAGALWLFMGDRTGGTFLSTDGGRTSVLRRAPLDGGVLVDAVPIPGGIMGALDAFHQPLWPDVVTLSLDGEYAPRFRLPGPSYSFHAVAGGGYLVGAAHEPAGDVYPQGDESAHLFASADGEAYVELWSCRRQNPADTARADVYWELASGEPVVEVRNCEGFGTDAAGYVILTPAS